MDARLSDSLPDDYPKPRKMTARLDSFTSEEGQPGQKTLADLESLVNGWRREYGKDWRNLRLETTIDEGDADNFDRYPLVLMGDRDETPAEVKKRLENWAYRFLCDELKMRREASYVDCAEFADKALKARGMVRKEWLKGHDGEIAKAKARK
jgi:hypothetical protein